MPAKISGDGLKRKRVPMKEKSKKRAKSESESESEAESDESNDPQAEILLLENEILESKKHYNNITKLIQIAGTQEDEPEAATLACVALCRVFVRLLSAGAFAFRPGQAEKEKVVVQWLRERYLEYKGVLASLLEEEDLASTALTLAMRCLKAEAQHFTEKEEYTFPHAFIEQIVRALLASDSDDVRVEFIEKYLTEYDDIRFFTLKAVKYVYRSSRDFLDLRN